MPPHTYGEHCCFKAAAIVLCVCVCFFSRGSCLMDLAVMSVNLLATLVSIFSQIKMRFPAAWYDKAFMQPYHHITLLVRSIFCFILSMCFFAVFLWFRFFFLSCGMLSYHFSWWLHFILIWTIFLTREMRFWWTTDASQKINQNSNRQVMIKREKWNDLNWHLKNIYHFESKRSQTH